MAQLATYVHDSTPVLTRATAAGQSLHDALSAPRTRKAQAAALEEYADRSTPRRRTSRARRAACRRPVQRTQIQAYRTSRRGPARSQPRSEAEERAQEVHDLQVAVATSSSTEAQKARIAAIMAFNRRSAKLRRLEADAQRERNRLERTLG